MMYLSIDNNTSSTFYDQIVALEGVEYLFEFQWSDRESCWYLNIYDQDSNPLALTVKLVINWRLLRRFQDPRLPPGVLLCADRSGGGTDIAAAADLGTRVALVYLTSDDPKFAGVVLP